MRERPTSENTLEVDFMRMTKTVLRAKLANLNTLTEGKAVFDLDFAYGGVRLVKYTNEHGGVSDISERLDMKEMGYTLDGIINTLYAIR